MLNNLSVHVQQCQQESEKEVRIEPVLELTDNTKKNAEKLMECIRRLENIGARFAEHGLGNWL